MLADFRGQTVQGLVHNYGGLLGLFNPFPKACNSQETVSLHSRIRSNTNLSNSFQWLFATGMRWMLGMFEAGLFPGVNYYLSWYVFLLRVCYSHVRTFVIYSRVRLLPMRSNLVRRRSLATRQLLFDQFTSHVIPHKREHGNSLTHVIVI